jgi:hypothetical protein
MAGTTGYLNEVNKNSVFDDNGAVAERLRDT